MQPMLATWFNTDKEQIPKLNAPGEEDKETVDVISRTPSFQSCGTVPFNC